MGNKQLKSKQKLEAKSTKISTTKPNSTEIAANKALVPKNGVQLWLECDADDRNLDVDKNGSVKLWKSKVGPIKLTHRNARLRVKSSVKSSPPFVTKENHIFGKKGIQTDYLHTFGLQPMLKRVRTIVSLHCWNQTFNDADVFNYETNPDGLCNFYIFCATDWSHYPFHTGANLNSQKKYNNVPPLVSGCADAKFQKSKISVNCGDFVPLSEPKLWSDPTIAVVETDGLMDNLKIDSIGAERQCHHFSGILFEVIVYDRVLSQSEIKDIQSYLCHKYYGPTIKVVQTTLTNLDISNDLTSLLLSYIMPIEILHQCDAEK